LNYLLLNIKVVDLKYLFTLGIVALLSNPFDIFAQEALYLKADFLKILETYDEVVVNMPGWEYKYTGNWKSAMAIERDRTLTFTRGKTVHSYDLGKVMFVQEEGTYVKLWFR